MFPLSINWDRLFSLGFWFNPRPRPFEPSTLNFVIILFIAIIVLAIVFKVLSLKDKDVMRRRVWRKLWTCFLTVGLIGETLNFFVWSRAGYLSMRLWYLILLIVLIVWLVLIVVYIIKKLPEQKKNKSEKDEFEKYLPK